MQGDELQTCWLVFIFCARYLQIPHTCPLSLISRTTVYVLWDNLVSVWGDGLWHSHPVLTLDNACCHGFMISCCYGLTWPSSGVLHLWWDVGCIQMGCPLCSLGLLKHEAQPDCRRSHLSLLPSLLPTACLYAPTSSLLHPPVFPQPLRLCWLLPCDLSCCWEAQLRSYGTWHEINDI